MQCLLATQYTLNHYSVTQKLSWKHSLKRRRTVENLLESRDSYRETVARCQPLCKVLKQMGGKLAIQIYSFICWASIETGEKQGGCMPSDFINIIKPKLTQPDFNIDRCSNHLVKAKIMCRLSGIPVDRV